MFNRKVQKLTEENEELKKALAESERDYRLLFKKYTNLNTKKKSLESLVASLTNKLHETELALEERTVVIHDTPSVRNKK